MLATFADQIHRRQHESGAFVRTGCCDGFLDESLGMNFQKNCCLKKNANFGTVAGLLGRTDPGRRFGRRRLSFAVQSTQGWRWTVVVRFLNDDGLKHKQHSNSNNPSHHQSPPKRSKRAHFSHVNQSAWSPPGNDPHTLPALFALSMCYDFAFIPCMDFNDFILPQHRNRIERDIWAFRRTTKMNGKLPWNSNKTILSTS